MRCLFEVGLIILVLAFVVSFFGGLGIAIDLSEYRIVPILEANPNRYLDYMRDTFVFCILPPAACLVFSIIAFVRKKKSPTELKWWPLTFVGAIFFFLWVYWLLGTYTSYLNFMHWVNVYGPVEIADPISKVYVAVMTGGILWLFTGILLMLSPIFKMMLREKEAPTTHSGQSSSNM